MPTIEFIPKMRNHANAKGIFKYSKWNASFEPASRPTELCCTKAGCEIIRLPIPAESYITCRLPASFFLDAFAAVGITEFNGFSPDSHHLTNWGFTQGACNYEKQHPTKVDCKVVLFLDAKRGNPYLLRVEGTTGEALLSGQPQSIFHFLHALEANGFFEPDEPIGAAYSI